MRAFFAGRLEILDVQEAYETGRLHELTAQLEREDVSVSKASDAALRAKEPDVRATTAASYRKALEHFRRFVGEDTLTREALTWDRIQEFKTSRLKGGAKPETINNDLIGISVLASYAIEKGWIDKRPKIKRFKTSVRVSYLEVDQLIPYFAVVRRAFRPIFQLLVGTGMRLGEVEALRACDLHIAEDGARALVRDAKTEAGVRPVFVPPWAAEAVQAHMEENGKSGTDRLFDIFRSTIQREHNRACRLAGVKHGYTLHDHRHSATVHLARVGMPLNLLSAQLGHTTIQMTMRYARFHPDYNDVRGYFDAVGEKLGLGRKPKPQVENTESLVDELVGQEGEVDAGALTRLTAALEASGVDLGVSSLKGEVVSHDS